MLDIELKSPGTFRGFSHCNQLQGVFDVKGQRPAAIPAWGEAPCSLAMNGAGAEEGAEKVVVVVLRRSAGLQPCEKPSKYEGL
jgi:hypothetical protein